MAAKKDNKETEHILEIKAYVPPKESTKKAQERYDDILSKHPRDRKYLSQKQHARAFAPEKKKVDDLLSYFEAKDWDVAVNKKTREVSIKVKATQKGNAENVDIAHLESLSFLNPKGDIHFDAKQSRGLEQAEDEIADPDNLKTGFVKLNQEKRVGRGRSIPLQEESHGHSVLEIAEAYNFPKGDGEGQTIGIIELGGKYEQSDMDTFFAKYGMDVPEIEIIGAPTKTPPNENVEVTADIQVAGVLAPKAKLVVYYGTSILNAMKSALSDPKNKLTVISISWAGSEMNYSEAEMNELNAVFYEASLRGITVIAASGDYGAYNNKKFPNVSVPTNFPYVLGCGGTKMEMANDTIAAEVVWNESQANMNIATGGGFSQRVNQPAYQQEASQNYINEFPQFAAFHSGGGRSIPDIAANAADASGYTIYYSGQWTKIGGTSLATPLWAALIALMNQDLGYQLGFINPFLYKLIGTDSFHPITYGNNNLYLGAVGWNPCTGLGTPNGAKLKTAIDTLK